MLALRAVDLAQTQELNKSQTFINSGILGKGKRARDLVARKAAQGGARAAAPAPAIDRPHRVPEKVDSQLGPVTTSAASSMKGEHERKGEDEVKENKEQKQGEQGPAVPAAAAAAPSGSGRARQPFTQLSQIESDMALARALQEQERAYMILRSGHDFGYRDGEESGDEDESEIDEQEAGSPELVDGSRFPTDEEYARALQEAEDRETTARMMAMAGIHDEAETEDDEEDDEDDEDDEQEDQFDDDEEVEDEEEEGAEDDATDYSEGVWQDVDPDNMSYEELIALGDVVGTQSKGLAADTIAELPVTSYKTAHSGSSSDSEQCVICRHDYEEDELLLTLPCKHNYHSECIQKWLQINKICPVCSAEVGSSQSK